MKTFKRVSSLFLALVMIVTMLSTGLTSLAAISVSKDDVSVSITVPELIYLTPGATTFQYYIAGAANGVTPSNAAASEGAISFLSSRQASSISVAYSGATVNLNKTSVTDTSSLAASITGGSVSSYTSGVITWTFTYVINEQTYKSYAYTYVYAPFLGQTGAQGGYKYKTSIGNEPVIVAYAFLVGIHSTKGISTSYESKFVGTADDKFKCPLVAGWGNANVPEGDGDGFFKDYTTYFTQSANGGVSAAGGRSRTGDKNLYYGDTNSYGILNIDSSRYSGTTLNMIPNFGAGWMVQYSKSSSTTHKLASFVSEDGALTFASNVNYTNEPGDQGEAFIGYKSSDMTPTTNTEYSVKADLNMERKNSSSVHMHLRFGLHINVVNKATLRAAINDAISANYQAFEYTSASLSAFNTKLKAAATVLGNPTASATQIQTAADELAAAESSLVLATCTVTVNHKLPAVDGFAYTYNGTTYTAAGGYITITESRSFDSGSNVTVSKETFNGFTYNGSTPTVVKKNCTASFTQDFVYTAVTSTINFDYGTGLDSYLLDADTKSITVTYGQPYGTFPSPKMDGWKFNGWTDGAGVAVSGSTVCKMISSKLDLKANWACYFTDGHGTAADPFRITTVADLDKIDDQTAYCITTDGSVTKGKYYKQEANIVYSLTKTPVLNFSGNYNGGGLEINIPTGKVVADSTYGGVFGAISGATIANIKLTLNGKLNVTGTGTTYAGFIGTATSSTIDNIQITTGASSEVKASKAGVLAASVTGSTVTNSSVVLNGGAISGDAFLGTSSGSTLRNTWVLVKTAPTGFTTSKANNIMRIRENGTADLTYSNGKYSFNAIPETGWSVEYRNADDTLVTGGDSYNPDTTVNGMNVYVCFVKTVAFASGANGSLTGSGSYVLRQGQTITGLTPNANDGYSFAGFSNTTDGKLSDTAPYSFTMGTAAGTVTANFSVNTYTLIYSANAGSAQIEVPAAVPYKATDKVIIASAPERAGYTFQNWNTKTDGTGSKYLPAQEYSALTTENGAEVTLYAIWTANKYTVTFMTNGGIAVNKMTEILYGTNITFPTTTKTGYKNLKWHMDAGFIDAGYLPGTTKQIFSDMTFYAEWTPITYTIVFSAEGATNVPASKSVQYDGGPFIIPESYVPVMAGYEFKGWDTAAGGNGTRYYPLDTVPGNLTTTDGGIITLYAQWKESSYTVTWDLAGGQINGSEENPTSVVTFGGLYTLPTGTMTKAGGKFAGWYTEPEGGSRITGSTTVSITADTSFYAHWDPATYTIAYNANGGKGEMGTTAAVYGQSVTLAENTFTRAGYTFSGWNTEAGGAGLSFGNAASVTNLTSTDGATVTLYAQWTGTKFSIVYNLNGVSGTLLATSVTMDGAAVALRNNTKTKTDGGDTYSFYGWAYSLADAQALKKVYDNKGTFALNEEILDKCEINWSASTPTITLYAVWARNTNVTWKLVGGSLDGSTKDITTVVTYGSNYVLPEGTPIRNRYEFSGWFTALEGGTQITNATVQNTTEDTTLYAHWIQIGNLDSSYTTEYYLQNADGTYPTEATHSTPSTAEIGIRVNAIVADYPGYTYDESNADNVASGIVLDNETEGTLVLKLYYTINKYTVSFNANGGEGEMEPQIFIYGTEADLNSCTFTRKGHSFRGWAKTADGAVAYANGGHFTIGTANVELFAVWEKLTYTITFDSDGGTAVASISAAYGDAITAPENPTKVGYTFLHWVISGTAGIYTIPETMPDANVSLTAVWQAVDYTLTYHANGADGTMDAVTFHVGDRVTLDAVQFTKTGYTFQGWALTETGAVKYVGGATLTAEAADIDLYAVWTANKYIIEFRGNGSGEGSMESMECTYDQTYTLPENAFSKTGAYFAGWATSASGTVAYENGATVKNLSSASGAKIILYAVWTNNIYTVTFDANGATSGTAPEARSTVYGQTITLPSADLAVESAATQESRTFLGWYTQDGTEYAVDASFTCPAGNVTFYALYSANYYALNLVTAAVKGYRDAQILPASAKNDPKYVEGGELAVELGTDGTYPWSSFDTTALEAAYAEAIKSSYRGLKQSEQATVDAQTAALNTALEGLTLYPVDYDCLYKCTSASRGEYENYSSQLYPPCTDNGSHSYNGLKAVVDSILNENESSCIYTAESVLALRIEVYGNDKDYAGIVKDLNNASLKLPAQSKLSQYVTRLAQVYHGTLKLKGADYSRVDALLTEYLPSKYNVEFSDISSYFTADSVAALLDYYDTYDREVKIVSQSVVDEEIYETLKASIDALEPVTADYTDVFYQILTIPSGTDGFDYPATDVVETNYGTWMDWAYANAGAISAVLDTEYLDARYTATSVAALGRVLDGIDWELGIFDQDSVNGAENSRSYSNLIAAAVAALELRTYTVNFLLNDGTDTIYTFSKGNYYGDSVDLPMVNPSREGYNFLGWGADAEGAQMIEGSVIVEADTAVYAIWELIYVPDLEMIIPEGATTVIDAEKNFIYGLKEMITKEELDGTYLDVIGNGHLEYDYSGYIGTGDTVRLVDDSTGETVATYTIIIFGDLNGDGMVNNQDVTIAKAMNAGTLNYSMTDAAAFASDLFEDGGINNSDITIMKNMQSGLIILDQATRKQTRV